MLLELQDLDISENLICGVESGKEELETAAVRDLSLSLSLSQSIKNINISNNSLSNRHIEVIALAASGAATFRSMGPALETIQITEAVFNVKALREDSEVDLSHTSGISPLDLILIAACVKENKTLRSFKMAGHRDICGPHYDDEGIKLLLDAFESTPLMTLNLLGNGLNDETVEKVIQKAETQRSKHISLCGVDDRPIQKVDLSEMDLRCNDLKFVNWELQHGAKETLTSLDLSKNNLTESFITFGDNWKQLIHILVDTDSISRLRVNQCRCCHRGVHEQRWCTNVKERCEDFEIL